MTPEQVKAYRIVYIIAAVLFIIIFAITGALLYIFFASVCLSISVNPEAVHRHNKKE